MVAENDQLGELRSKELGVTESQRRARVTQPLRKGDPKALGPMQDLAEVLLSFTGPPDQLGDGRR